MSFCLFFFHSGLDEYYCYEEEQKSEHEGNPFCDESHPYSIAHGGHPYDGNYGRLMNTRSAPPIDPVTGVSLGWNADQYNFMLIPFSALIIYCFAHNIAGYVCPHCGVINPAHPRRLAWSGSFAAPVVAVLMRRTVGNGPIIDARDPAGFAGM